jgi:inner membrane protein
MAWWSVVSLLPDIDVIGFSLGVHYGDPWGHRGATHSLMFAVAIAGALGLAARALKRPPLRTWAIATGVLVSHGLLDTLTTGGLGSALLWPFDLTRYFAPWRPIPVAPIGLSFFSVSGCFVATTEIVLFAPVFLYSLRPKRFRIALVPVWAAAAWLIASRDPVRESVLGLLLREDTEYARGFSEEAFRAIKPGQSEAAVRERVGQPLGEYWDYFSGDEPAGPNPDPGCPFVYLESDIVVVLARDLGPATRLCAQRGVTAGMSRAEVQRMLGSPRDVCLRYSRGVTRRFHRARTVCFSGGKVVALVREWQPG